MSVTHGVRVITVPGPPAQHDQDWRFGPDTPLQVSAHILSPQTSMKILVMCKFQLRSTTDSIRLRQCADLKFVSDIKFRPRSCHVRARLCSCYSNLLSNRMTPTSARVPTHCLSLFYRREQVIATQLLLMPPHQNLITCTMLSF